MLFRSKRAVWAERRCMVHWHVSRSSCQAITTNARSQTKCAIRWQIENWKNDLVEEFTTYSSNFRTRIIMLQHKGSCMDNWTWDVRTWSSYLTVVRLPWLDEHERLLHVVRNPPNSHRSSPNRSVTIPLPPLHPYLAFVRLKSVTEICLPLLWVMCAPLKVS